MSEPRSRQRQDVAEAYSIQTRSGIQGALRGGSIGVGLTIISHYTWPFFRRQTFQFKGFIVCTCTVFGLVISAERALQEYEALRRWEENDIRKEARLHLAQQGIIPTETAIAKWRANQEADTERPN
ncbi:hypothetical protein DFH08DRAFT_676988 [Mycena albidolilacea]|uniref:Uncharacterized protein n=1 Tax=Mycena albidolilacea TaxID=1033008 RepID=A0AAD7AUC9_9AGAR|nr:hypothetical protein DFH08DRAFT_676988 [Mycena albidolilacea]